MSYIFHYTLEQFLASQDFDDGENYELNGPQWIWFYNRAKKSYEQYGPDGPPIGTDVSLLFKSPGKVVTFQGEYKSDLPIDKEYFALTYDCHYERRISTIIVKKTLWFKYFIPYKIDNWNRRHPDAIPWRH